MSLHDDEYVVDADGQHEERNDLDDDQGGGQAEEAEYADRAEHRGQDDQDTAEAEGYFGIHLEIVGKGELIRYFKYPTNDSYVMKKLVPHEKCTAGAYLPEGYGDVREHNDVRDENGQHVGLGFSVQFVLDGAFGGERDVHVGWLFVFRPVFHELDVATGKRNIWLFKSMSNFC